MGREERKREIAERLTVELEAGVRVITLDGTEAVGRLMEDPRSQRWILDWRPDAGLGWTLSQVELEHREPEVAELWAVEEVAALLAMGEEAGRPEA